MCVCVCGMFGAEIELSTPVHGVYERSNSNSYTARKGRKTNLIQDQFNVCFCWAAKPHRSPSQTIWISKIDVLQFERKLRSRN